MSFFFIENLTDKVLKIGNPWEFVPTENITEKIRKDKHERQAFYRNPNTKHFFYTLTEPQNPNLRPSKDNPPRLLHGVAADYDVVIPDSRVTEVVNMMSIPPAWIEKSLGNKTRLVWTFENPIFVDGYEHALFILQQSHRWLTLDLLPGLDSGALIDPARLLCCGSPWTRTEHGHVPANTLQAFLIKCGRDFRFTPGVGSNTIPLDVIEKALREKFSFDWPGEFVENSQGPSFWIEGSTSPNSALVKSEGMLTFADHASQPFYSWVDLLGADFAKKFSEDSLAKATQDIYFDGKHFWRRIQGTYRSCGEREMVNYFKVTCRMSSKPDKSTGISQVDVALDHIYHHARISGAAPFIFRPHGRIDFQGEPILNISMDRVMKPSEEPQEWGKNFPWLAQHFDQLFDPPLQLPHFLAWFKHFYSSGFEQKPRPGQNIYLMGEAGRGKTLTSRAIVGKAVGGFVDASDYLVKGDNFGSENFHVPLFCIDDETPGGTFFTADKFFNLLKKTAANQAFRYNKKFEVASTIEWMGRVFVTTNLDYVSSRMLPSLDKSSAGKVSIFRCSDAKVVFPERYELHKIIARELPFFLRWLIDWTPPDFIERDVRYGYAHYHEPSLVDQTHQTHRSAPFREVLLEEMMRFFKDNPTETVWKGSLTSLIRLFAFNPLNDSVLKGITTEHANRFLEQIQREGVLKIETEVGAHKTRIWVIQRIGTEPSTPETPQTMAAVVPIFSK